MCVYAYTTQIVVVQSCTCVLALYSAIGVDNVFVVVYSVSTHYKAPRTMFGKWVRLWCASSMFVAALVVGNIVLLLVSLLLLYYYSEHYLKRKKK